MLLDPHDWSLAQRIDDVLPRLSPELASQAPETHGAAIELASHPHDSAEGAAREIVALRASLARELAVDNLRVASAGTHPFALWTGTQISSGARYQLVYEAMRELARREPTFALHVHIGLRRARRSPPALRRLPRADVPVVGRPAPAALRDRRGADHGRADHRRRDRRARPTGGGCPRALAPGSTRSWRSTAAAPTPCASACSRCPRPRTSATARRRSSRASASPTSSSTPRSSSLRERRCQ